jgi:hypothetical protein
MFSRRSVLGLTAGSALILGAGSKLVNGSQPDGLAVSESWTTHNFRMEFRRHWELPTGYRVWFNVGRDPRGVPDPRASRPCDPKVERAITKFYAISSVRDFAIFPIFIAGLRESYEMCVGVKTLDDADAAAGHAFGVAKGRDREDEQDDFDSESERMMGCVEFSTHFADYSVKAAKSDEDQDVPEAGTYAANALAQFETYYYERGDTADQRSWIWDLVLSTLAGTLAIERSLMPERSFARRWV